MGFVECLICGYGDRPTTILALLNEMPLYALPEGKAYLRIGVVLRIPEAKDWSNTHDGVLPHNKHIHHHVAGNMKRRF